MTTISSALTPEEAAEVSRRVALVVDPYSSGSLLAPAFREAGIAPVALLTSPSSPAVVASSYRPGDFGAVVVHAGSLSETIDRVRALGPHWVFAGCETGVELADQVAAALTP
ncbi:MAG: hypothetical protein M3072_09195, partial [Candidatus Dormibacteraeota bacterium]|nr:hypothetical protein [Candidatus Dormibacteraeota bacterium]